MKKRDSMVIVHDIRSNLNVGSIFRTADACAVSKIYLTGYSPAPKDRFNRDVREIQKTALGAEKNVPWEKVKNIKKLLILLREKKYQIVALEQSPQSVDYKKVKCGSRVVFIVGNEVTGLSSDILKLCDVTAEIPMKGGKESLNVSVALGVALFRMLNI